MRIWKTGWRVRTYALHVLPVWCENNSRDEVETGKRRASVVLLFFMHGVSIHIGDSRLLPLPDMITYRVRTANSHTFPRKSYLRPRSAPSCALFTAVSLFSFSVRCAGGLLSSKGPHILSTTASSSSCLNMSTFTVAQFRSRSDNYGYLLHDPETGATAAIDTPDAQDYQNELSKRGWKLSAIFNTHHHHDHTGGNLALKKDGVTITGPINEKSKIPGIDYAVGGGDIVRFGNVEGQVIDVGGHTSGHIAYLFPQQRKVFVGDALFSLGCGKMFEGTPGQFWDSLQRLRQLPDDTIVYW